MTALWATVAALPILAIAWAVIFEYRTRRELKRINAVMEAYWATKTPAHRAEVERLVAQARPFEEYR